MIEWNGESLTGKSIFVKAEQGLGDEILYATMLEGLCAIAGTVFWEADKRLIPLLRRSYPQAVCVERFGRFVPSADYGIKAGDLGRFLRGSASMFPANGPTLQADDLRTHTFWRGMPSAVGISWSSSNPKVGARKTVPLDQWGPILGLNLPFVALQPDGPPNAWAAPFDTQNDIDGLAALLCACSRVVTVSNTVAHLAGALGVRTHVMVPSNVGRFWYWGHEGERTPWYPTVRIHRQVGDDWGAAVKSVAEALS